MTRLTLFPLCFIALVIASVFVASCRQMPTGMNTDSALLPFENGHLWADNTAVDGQGKRHIEQEIFDEFFRLIEQAERLVFIDMFLFNDFQGETPEKHRAVASELTNALIAKKRAAPHLPVVLITDPFNHLYGGLINKQLEALSEAGVQVVNTDLTALPDSNKSWSGIWRVVFQWWGNNPKRGWLPNPVGPGKVTLRTYLTLINFKANHRKTLVVDEGEQWTALVTSANPHDGSSAHSNTAITLSGQAALAVLQSEQAVLSFSAPKVLHNTPWPEGLSPKALASSLANAAQSAGSQVQLITEKKIETALLQAVQSAQPGDNLWLEVFYFSHIPLQKALLAAHERGVSIKIILDPNKDAFGRKKNGIPNRQVAAKLHQQGIPVRWCNTHGEQCHSKWLLKQSAAGTAELILGSANFTRRNLSGFNLETNVRIVGPHHDAVLTRAEELYKHRWENKPFGAANGERLYTVGYEKYEDNSRWRKGLYWFMEKTGWSTF